MGKSKVLFCVLIFFVGCSARQENGAYYTYYKTGVLKSVQSFEHGALNGISRQYYDTGTLKHAINYNNDEIDGLHNTYYPNGALWINETYSQGNLVTRREYNEEGELTKEESYYQE